MKQTTKVTFIGAGNMASSIIKGLLNNGWQANNITASTPDTTKLRSLQQQLGIMITTDNAATVANADVVMLCVKPQIIQQVLSELAPALPKNALLISIAAGITIASLQQWAGNHMAIVRTMPNTPAMLQTGATGLFANSIVTDAQRQLANTLFSAVGVAKWVDNESLLDAVTALSGSGPAYYFLFMELMAAAGEQLGLDSETAKALTIQTALGAAKMAEQEPDVALLRRQVTSPNGTTERAIDTLQAGDLSQLLQQAMQAAADRAAELAELNK